MTSIRKTLVTKWTAMLKKVGVRQEIKDKVVHRGLLKIIGKKANVWMIMLICFFCIVTFIWFWNPSAGSHQQRASSFTIVYIDNRWNTSSDFEIESGGFWEHSAAITARYAALHSYDMYRVSHSDRRHGIPIRSVVISQMLAKESVIESDWILMLDSDAFMAPKRFNETLDDLLSEFSVTDDVHMIIEHEPAQNWHQWKNMYSYLCPESEVSASSRANSGAYLVRNSEIGRQIFEIYKQSNYQRHHQNNSAIGHPWTSDQMPFNCDVRLHAKYKRHILVDQDQLFVRFRDLYAFKGQTDNPWIHHLTTKGKQIQDAFQESKAYSGKSMLVTCDGGFEERNLTCDFSKSESVSGLKGSLFVLLLSLLCLCGL